MRNIIFFGKFCVCTMTSRMTCYLPFKNLKKKAIHASSISKLLLLLGTNTMSFTEYYHYGKVSKYGVISGPYFPVSGQEITVFGHFSRSDIKLDRYCCKRKLLTLLLTQKNFTS